MKKHLIAAAVAAAVSVPAVAQVTVSGTIDINPFSQEKITTGNGGTTLERTGTNGGPNRAGAWSTSNLAFSGSEDLGGGLKAGFFFNQELRQTDGSENARDYWLSVSGGFGALQFGRMATLIEGTYGAFAVSGTTNTAGTSDSVGFDLVGGTLGNVQGAFDAAATIDTVDAGSAARQSGVVRYTTPTFSGLSAAIELIDTETDSNTSNVDNLKARQTTAALNYSMGKMKLAVATATRKTTDSAGAETRTTGAVNAKADIFTLGASYDFGMALVKYAYGTRKDESAAATTSDIKVHNIGLTIPVGAVTVIASYYDGEDERNSAANQKKNLNGSQFGLRYALSKRTSAYLVTGSNEMKATGTATDGVKRSQSAIGVVHSF